MKIEIKSRYTGAVIFSLNEDGLTVKRTVENAVKAKIDALTPQYVARISAWQGEISAELRKELSNMSGFVGMGIRCGMFTEDDALVKAVRSALANTKSAVTHY